MLLLKSSSGKPTGLVAMSGLDELLSDFLAECQENLDQMDSDLVQLESAPDDRPVLDRVFRTLHTIKGNSGFLNFERLGDLAHAGESLLDRMRHGALQCSAEICDRLLELVDAIRASLKHISKSGRESDDDYDRLKQQLRGLAGSLQEPVASEDDLEDDAEYGATMVSTSSSGDVDDVERFEPVEASPMDVPTGVYVAPPAEEQLANPVNEAGGSTLPSQKASDSETSRPLEPAAETPAEIVATETASMPAAAASPVETPSSQAASDSNAAGDSKARRGSGISSSNVRVDVDLLDELMNLVGELVLTRNQIVQRVRHQTDAGLVEHSQRLNMIATELQERFMMTRMQRIGSVWQRFPRMVRDVSRQCGKRVHLEMEGEETELDRTLLEAITDPLTHTIRNAIDHGIEHPKLRKSARKPEVGTIKLRAYHEGGHVNVEVVDDGAGLDPERIRAKAVQNNLYDAKEIVLLSQSELLQSVFLPGFSTAEAITNVSGRGVGMDVVKTNIERIGGTVQLESKPGVGTTIRMKVPLTLAIIPALIVKSRGHRFAIPQVNVLELFSLNHADEGEKIERVHTALVYRLRGQLIPLVKVDDLLNLSGTGVGDGTVQEQLDALGGRGVDVVVLQVHDRQLGLIVDQIQDSEEIVVKPLSCLIHDVPAYAGATILGDGRVSLILDGAGIARMTNIFENQQQHSVGPVADDAATSHIDFADGLLVCSLAGDCDTESLNSAEESVTASPVNSPEHRVAISLSDVIHIRQFSFAELSHAADQQAVRFEGRILPLCNLAAELYGLRSPAPDDGQLRVVICGQDDAMVGLIVDRVLDIASTPKDIRPADRVDMVGSAIIDGHITDILDAPVLVRPVTQTVNVTEEL
ncbi:MAG: chemotaxis protein CheW [Planctomycetales bacterium]